MARGKKLQTALPGFGFVYRPTYGPTDARKHSSIWWLAYNPRSGPEIRRPTKPKTRDQREAYEQLQAEYDRLRRGELDTPTAERITIGRLLDDLLDAHAEHAQLRNQKTHVEMHIRPVLGSTRAIDLRRGAVEKFADALEAKGLSAGTVNRILVTLHSALKLGSEADPPLVLRIPAFPWRTEDNARQGIVSREWYEAVRNLLPAHAQLALVIGYHTGLRKGLILSLEWSWVDLDAGVIRIPAAQDATRARRTSGKVITKSKPRLVPIWGEMRPYLEMARTAATSPFVVEYESERVFDIKRSWRTACKAAGVDPALFHDLRRTAATLMHDVLRLAPEQIMGIVGWKTMAMFRRYHIGSEKSVQRLGREMDEAMAAHLGQRAETRPKGRTM